MTERNNEVFKKKQEHKWSFNCQPEPKEWEAILYMMNKRKTDMECTRGKGCSFGGVGNPESLTKELI